MKHLLLPLLLLIAVAAGCADGGPVGTGISGASAVSGNVVAVDHDKGGRADEPVRVSIDEVPGLETSTDGDGNFELSGDFAGVVTLRFTAAEISATRAIEVPDDARLVLQDVIVSRRGVAVDTVRLLGFYGRIAMVDCDDDILLVDDRHPAANQFLVRLTDDTTLNRAEDGNPIECADLNPGDPVAIEGAIRFVDRTILAVTLTVAPIRKEHGPAKVELHFRGRAVVITCAGSMLLLDDPAVGRTRLRLSERTTIVDQEMQSIECEDIEIGDRVEGRGLIHTRRPGVVEARSLLVRPPL